jgi:radical SAM superfamily enzyme
MLPENMVIHRLTGDSPRDLLIGPMWSLKKWEILNAIDKRLKDNKLYQGLDFSTN